MNSLPRPLPRYLTADVERALREFPVVVLTGARQTGKSTLARDLLGGPARDYRTLDDFDLLERAQSDPDALVSSSRPLTLDEVQRSPDLLLAIKRAVDADRRPGRFLLTGSANLQLLGRVAETLAGRAVYKVLMPFTRSERLGRGSAGRWSEILENPAQLEGEHAAFPEWQQAALAGGFPPAALAPSPSARIAWLEGYVQTYLERDVQALSAVEHLVDFRRLMRIAALRSGKLVNQSEMARDAGLAQATAHRYLNLLDASHLLYRVPAYAVNRTKRLVKSPRLFFCDSGLATALAGVHTPREMERAEIAGAMLETVVLAALHTWREACSPKPEVLWWRTAAGEEVDFVVEWGERLVPIEVKASGRPRPNDVRHLHAFLDEYAGLATHGVLLHTGARAERLSQRVWAIPLTRAL
ncbi:MAG: ATP-binding protein [Planctomycetes bacterium]|nr:ATP-binding protein [Planctomycetota bacterium]